MLATVTIYKCIWPVEELGEEIWYRLNYHKNGNIMHSVKNILAGENLHHALSEGIICMYVKVIINLINLHKHAQTQINSP